MMDGRDMLHDKKGYRIQVFTPRLGRVLPSLYIPEESEVVVLASDITLTLNGISVDYSAGAVLGLRKGITYTFSTAVNVHEM